MVIHDVWQYISRGNTNVLYACVFTDPGLKNEQKIHRQVLHNRWCKHQAGRRIDFYQFINDRKNSWYIYYVRAYMCALLLLRSSKNTTI